MCICVFYVNCKYIYIIYLDKGKKIIFFKKFCLDRRNNLQIKMPSVKSLITDIEHLSKTRNTYSNELSFAGRGLKLNSRQDGKFKNVNSHLNSFV